MLDEQAVNNMFDQIDKFWVLPEINKRKQNNKLPEDFKIYQCLIKLPKDTIPIVEFNDEIKWVAKVKFDSELPIKKGDPIYLHNIKKIEAVESPEINNIRVAFVYFYFTGQSYNIIFDFSPNTPESMISKDKKEEWLFGEEIAKSLQAIITEKTIHIHDNIQDQLRKIGLWAVPSLLPFPLSKISKELSENNILLAKTTLINHCNSEFINSIINKWWYVEEFLNRKKLIIDAFDAHKNNKYSLCIHALLPQIEGIITDYIYNKHEEKEIPWRQESKIKKFKDSILQVPSTSYTFQRIIETSIDFILNGPVLSTFNNWKQEIDKIFPNRHAIEHGKYDEDLYTKENSIKLFLLLDTIYFVINR
jgi:hypothetical protein